MRTQVQIKNYKVQKGEKRQQTRSKSKREKSINKKLTRSIQIIGKEGEMCIKS